MRHSWMVCFVRFCVWLVTVSCWWFVFFFFFRSSSSCFEERTRSQTNAQFFIDYRRASECTCFPLTFPTVLRQNRSLALRYFYSSDEHFSCFVRFAFCMLCIAKFEECARKHILQRHTVHCTSTRNRKLAFENDIECRECQCVKCRAKCKHENSLPTAKRCESAKLKYTM